MSSQDVQSLFDAAQSAGTMSAKAVDAINIQDYGQRIQAGLGISPDDISATEVCNVFFLMDDSSSMFHQKTPGAPTNLELAMEGHNLIRDSLLKTKQKDGILMSASALNRGLIYPSALIQDAPVLDSSNFVGGGNTPLYDQSTVVLGMAAARQQQFENNGVPSKTIVPIVSDGADYGSRTQRASHVKNIVDDLLRTESFIVIGVGIDDGTTDFRSVFQSMGIQDRWILVPGNSPSEIRKAFAMVSQSVSRASQNAGAFSKTAMGGFAG